MSAPAVKPSSGRRALLAQVHMAKKQLALHDDSYRAVLSRIVRRCGLEAVQPHVPAEDAPLLKYLVKEAARRVKRRILVQHPVGQALAQHFGRRHGAGRQQHQEAAFAQTHDQR